jgi:hypothetical protein
MDILDRLTAYHETGDPAELDQGSRDRRDYVDTDVHRMQAAAQRRAEWIARLRREELGDPPPD